MNQENLKLIKKCISLHKEIDKKMINEGTINIKYMPHEIRYFDNITKKEGKYSLSLIYSTKPESIVKFKNVKHVITANDYKSELIK